MQNTNRVYFLSEPDVMPRPLPFQIKNSNIELFILDFKILPILYTFFNFFSNCRWKSARK